jgi:predicted TIM-barrel fold metal-dependent hydrolase
MSRGLPYAGIDYGIIDSDAHALEPADTWTKRTPAKLHDRVPKSVQMKDGSLGWSIDNGRIVRPIISPLTSGGLQSSDVNPQRVVTYETMRPSHYDPVARLKDMDLDGIAAAIIYPTVGLGGALAFTDDREMQLACVRAYNDWLVEDFCGRGEGRLFGLAILPVTGVDDTIAEAQDAMKKGHRGVILSRWPNGSQRPEPVDDRFWAMAADSNLPVTVHFGPEFGPTIIKGEGMGPDQLGLGTLSKCGVTSIPVLDTMLGQAIAERFPKLKILFSECNIGWIPSYLEQADDRWLHYRFYTGKEHLKLTPSQQWRRNYWASFMCDRFGIEMRDYIGVDRIMWSTDFPHGGHEWPNSRNQIDRLFRGVPEEDTRMILHDNAANFYRLTGV